ncbi:hypothetical protein FACS1894164_04350 [Spirochaetia bacterium]|nr:hypothetical protein FACS1894164_04350 [Spirochaetia bacterium]
MDKRKDTRFSTVASVSINGFEGEALIRDISPHGFGMVSKTFILLNPDEHYQMRIIPESSLNVSAFSITVTLRWSRSTTDYFMAGFGIIDSAAEPLLLKYINAVTSLH